MIKAVAVEVKSQIVKALREISLIEKDALTNGVRKDLESAEKTLQTVRENIEGYLAEEPAHDFKYSDA